MHDSTRFEMMGLPAVAIATHEFTTAARAQAAALSRPDYELVYVDHPIQDQTQEEIESRADQVIDEIIARLTGVSLQELS